MQLLTSFNVVTSYTTFAQYQMKRTNIYLSDVTINGLKTLAKRQGTSMAELIRTVLIAYLKEHGMIK